MSNLFLQVNKDLFGSGLDPVALLVLSQVQEFHRNKAVCYMTDAEMAKNFGTSAKTISRRLDELEVKGYIKRQSKCVGGKMQRTIVPVIEGEKETADNLSIESNENAEADNLSIGNKSIVKNSADNLSPNFNKTIKAKQLQADNLSISNRQNDPIKYNIKDKSGLFISPMSLRSISDMNNPSRESCRSEEDGGFKF